MYSTVLIESAKSDLPDDGDQVNISWMLRCLREALQHSGRQGQPVVTVMGFLGCDVSNMASKN